MVEHVNMETTPEEEARERKAMEPQPEKKRPSVGDQIATAVFWTIIGLVGVGMLVPMSRSRGAPASERLVWEQRQAEVTAAIAEAEAETGRTAAIAEDKQAGR